MSRAETQSPERLETYALTVQERANAALAGLHFAATYGEIVDTIRDIVPDDWEWVDARYVGGPCLIAITQYSRA